MICLSLGNYSVKDLKDIVGKYDFAEIRLDLIESIDISQIKDLIDINGNLIITYRGRQGINNDIREKYYSAAIDFGVRYIDLDIENDEDILKNIDDKLDNGKTKLILSYHNYNKTPNFKNIMKIVNDCKNRGANLVKIATKINKKEDNFVLLKILENEPDTLIVGMGILGKISRIISVFLGAPFTYASLSETNKTADGQISFKGLNTIFKYLK